MSDIDIQRDHELGMPAARDLAWRWAEDAEARLGMSCTYEEGEEEYIVHFERSGVNGQLRVTAQVFVLQARLGFLLAAFKPRIEQEIQSNLDQLLGLAEAKKPASPRGRRAAATKRTAADKPASGARKKR